MEAKDINALGKNNRGFMRERINHCEREKAFAELWEKENKESCINQGHGILQNLFFDSRRNLFGVVGELSVTHRERFIAATVVQWLATNCGMAFLDTALKNCGFKIVELSYSEKQKIEAMNAEEISKTSSRFLQLE